MVAPLKLHDLVAARVAARKANRAHAGFGAGTHQTHLLDVGHDLDDFFRELRFPFGDGAERKAFFNGFLNGLNYRGVIVPENHRAPGADVVDELLAFSVPHIGALGLTDKAGSAAHASESTHRGIHAARNRFLSAFKQFFINAHFCCLFVLYRIGRLSLRQAARAKALSRSLRQENVCFRTDFSGSLRQAATV